MHDIAGSMHDPVDPLPTLHNYTAAQGSGEVCPSGGGLLYMQFGSFASNELERRTGRGGTAMEDLNGKQITTSKARCNWLPDRAWAVKSVDVIALRSDRLAVHEATDPSGDSRPRTRNEPCVW